MFEHVQPKRAPNNNNNRTNTVDQGGIIQSCEATLETRRKFTQSHNSGKLREKSLVLSRRLKVDKELDERTSGDSVPDSCSGNHKSVFATRVLKNFMRSKLPISKNKETISDQTSQN